MNFSLLNPLFLIGLAALALPVIAHLISRRSAVKIDFPAVRFLTAASGATAARSRLKDLVLFLLRVFIIVLLVLMFAKPAFFSYAPTTGGEPESVAILIDNSFSMGYAGNLEKAKKRAIDVIDSLPDGSFALASPLVSYGPQPAEVTSEKTALKNQIESIDLSASFADNEKLIESLYSALAKSPVDKKRVIFFTDLQRNGWSGREYRRDWLTVVDITEGAPLPNRAVTGIRNYNPGGAPDLSVNVKVFFQQNEDPLLVSAYFGDSRITESAQLPETGETALTFEFPGMDKEGTKGPGSLRSSGRVEIPHDDLRIDDTRYFTAASQGGSYLIVDGDPRENARLSESYYVAGALDTLGKRTGAPVTVKDNESFLSGDLEPYRAVFLANAGDIGVGKSKELAEFVNSGGSLVIFLGDRIRGSLYNALLGDILPAEIGSRKDGEFGMKPADGQSMLGSDTAERLRETRAFSIFTTVPSPGAETIIETATGEPVLIKNLSGDGNVFLFTTGANTDWSDFPISTVFVPVLSALLESSGSGLKSGNYMVGDTVSISLETAGSRMTVTDPEDKESVVDPASGEFRSTYFPGVYTVSRDRVPLYEFSVNVDPRESNTEKLDFGAGKEESAGNGRLVKVFREIWPYFLWGAILLFVSESAVRAFSGAGRKNR